MKCGKTQVRGYLLLAAEEIETSTMTHRIVEFRALPLSDDVEGREVMRAWITTAGAACVDIDTNFLDWASSGERCVAVGIFLAGAARAAAEALGRHGYQTTAASILSAALEDVSAEE